MRTCFFLFDHPLVKVAGKAKVKADGPVPEQHKATVGPDASQASLLPTPRQKQKI